ncbi:MAG: hypothetical protein DYH16_08670, partial [Nitrosomonas sp. PRO5]|nr:hypothetical protein [Nitrosomonas sp. PRO5]
MRKRMQHDIRQAEELPLASLVVFRPTLEALHQLQSTRLDGRTAQPVFDGSFRELQEHTFAAIFDSGQPFSLTRQLRPRHTGIQFPFHVRRGGFQAGEANLGRDLPQPVHQHHTLDGLGAWRVPLCMRKRARIEIAIRNVIA